MFLAQNNFVIHLLNFYHNAEPFDGKNTYRPAISVKTRLRVARFFASGTYRTNQSAMNYWELVKRIC